MSLSRTLARRLGLPLLGCLFAAAVTAQIERPIPYPIPEDRDWDKAVAAGTRTAIGRPGANYWTNHASYRIKAELDPATAKVSGHVEMTYENRSPGRLRELKVHLRQNLHKAGGMRNRPVEITGGVTVANVTLGGEPLPENRRRSMFRRSPPGYSIDGTVMTIVLPERLRRGAKVTLGMDWQYQVP
jgi:hypothetical protein